LYKPRLEDQKNKLKQVSAMCGCKPAEALAKAVDMMDHHSKVRRELPKRLAGRLAGGSEPLLGPGCPTGTKLLPEASGSLLRSRCHHGASKTKNTEAMMQAMEAQCKDSPIKVANSRLLTMLRSTAIFGHPISLSLSCVQWEMEAATHQNKQSERTPTHTHSH
jgi:hypothetical protein